MTDGLSEEDKMKLDMELEKPRPGEVPTDGLWSEKAMGSDFEKAMAAFDTPKPKNLPQPSTLPPPDQAVE